MEFAPHARGSGDPFMAEMVDTAERLLIPLHVMFEITMRCNIRCAHCFNFDRNAPRAVPPAELSAEEIHDLIDQVRDAGALFVSFTGGEAMLHPRLGEFVRHARRRHCVVNVKSNGTLLDAAAVARLVDAGVHHLDVSAYGARPETHDGFTGIPGSLERTLRGVRHAKDAGLGVKLNYTLLRTNADEIGEMIALAVSLGVICNIDAHVTRRHDGTGKADPRDLRVDRATLERLYRGPLASLTPGPLPSEQTFQCACARSNCAIASSGDVYPCIAAPMPCGNVRRARFADIWRNSPQFAWIRGLTREDFPTCRACPHRAFCARVSGTVYSSTGDYTGAEPFTCMEAEVVHALHDERPGEP